jgi:hypothetical protein
MQEPETQDPNTKTKPLIPVARFGYSEATEHATLPLLVYFNLFGEVCALGAPYARFNASLLVT